MPAGRLLPIAADDDTLVDRACRGDQRALDDLLRAHYARLFAVCRRLCGNDADAADASQDAMIAIARGLRSFDRRSRFSTWAYRVAVNASLDELRRRRRRPQPAELAVDGPGALAGRVPASPLVAGGPELTRGIEAAADRLDVDAALVRLAPEFRAPVVLRDLCGLDYAEIAEVLEIPPGTVRSRIARGRAALVGLLGGECVR